MGKIDWELEFKEHSKNDLEGENVLKKKTNVPENKKGGMQKLKIYYFI